MKTKPTLAFLLTLGFAAAVFGQSLAPVAAGAAMVSDMSVETSSTHGAAAPENQETKKTQWLAEIGRWTGAREVGQTETVQSVEVKDQSVIIRGTANGDVSVRKGDVAILGTVNGNVNVKKGTVTNLGRVNGHISVAAGDIRNMGTVTGKMDVTTGSILSFAKNSIRTVKNASQPYKYVFSYEPRWHPKLFLFSPFLVLLRCGLLILWICASLVVAAVFQQPILCASKELLRAPGRNAGIGFVWAILYFFLFLCSLCLCLILIGIPLVMILIVLKIALHVFGLTVTFYVVGGWLLGRLRRPVSSIYLNVFTGVCLLGVIRLIPILGGLTWFVAGLFGIGATLASRFGTVRLPASSPVPSPVPGVA